MTSHSLAHAVISLTSGWANSGLLFPLISNVPQSSPFCICNPLASPSFLSVCLSVCLSVYPPPLLEMKEKKPWLSPATIIITVIGVIAIVALVTILVLQNRPAPQKYKVWQKCSHNFLITLTGVNLIIYVESCMYCWNIWIGFLWVIQIIKATASVTTSDWNSSKVNSANGNPSFCLHSMGSFWMLALLTQLFISISGQQRRIITLEELRRNIPAK